MTDVLPTGVFCTVDDPAYLHAACDVLADLIGDFDRLAAGQASDRVLHTARALIRDRLGNAQNRLDQLSTLQPPREPVVLDPAELPAIHSLQGQPLSPVVSRPAVAAEGISSAEVWMPPGHAAHAHVHHDTDIVVLLRDGAAVTLWWDEQGGVHELHQRAGQHLHIPRGVPHAALNLGSRPVVATEFRSNPVFDADNHRLPDLEPMVVIRLQAAYPAA